MNWEQTFKKQNLLTLACVLVTFFVTLIAVSGILTHLDMYVLLSRDFGSGKAPNERMALRAWAVTRAVIAATGLSYLVSLITNRSPRWFRLIVAGLLGIMLVEAVIFRQEWTYWLYLWSH